MFDVGNNSFGDRYGVSNDVKGNLNKSKNILKKSLDSISAARAWISRADKTFLCDKEYVNENLHDLINIFQ